MGDDFIRSTADTMAGMQAAMASLMQTDRDNNVIPGEGAFANFVAPLPVTQETMSQIKELPVAESVGGRSLSSDIWLLHTLVEPEHEGTSFTCFVHQVTKEHGSNGAVLPNSDGFGVNLAMSGLLDTSNDLFISRPRILLGTLAKACLNPGLTAGMNVSMPGINFSRSKPRKVLFQTMGELAMVEPDLRKMGIYECDVAERALIQSIELHNSAMNDSLSMHTPESMAFGGRAGLAEGLLAQGNTLSDPYVDERPLPFRGWRVPSDSSLPAHWYIRPPRNRDSWRPTELLGWRTNLERAVLREDVTKVKEIVAVRDAGHIREFVECRMLLTKCAQRGLIVACTLLIDDCGASVEGAQTPDAESWWLDVQNSSGNCDSLTPLHQAAREGQDDSIILLLDKGAEIDRVDKSRVRATALHHAVSTGQIDCVQILCERGASHTYQGHGGDALDISELVAASGNIYRSRVQEKVSCVLREYDTRCSFCQSPNAPKACPCRKERYCDATCQKARWKNHKRYHKMVIEGQS